MSYILDALRKADAQRERDASRGIHAHTATPGAAEKGEGPAGRAGCAAIAAAVIGVAALAGWYFARSEPPQTAAVVTPQPTSPSFQAPQSPQAPQAAQSPVANAISPPPPAPVVPLAPPRAAPAAVQARESAPSAQGSAPAVPVAGGLPPDAPRVAITGGVYSPNPAQRMLIVNGQVFNEGSEVAPGVKVESIQPRTAILGFRGARYTIAY
jgi:general secretion pathway protein B